MGQNQSETGEGERRRVGPGGEICATALRDLQNGEIAALEGTFEVYGSRVFNLCFGILGRRADAEDACQEVFLRAFQQASTFDGRARFSTWLLRLAANHALNLAKAAGRRLRLSRPLPEDLLSAAPPVEHGAQQEERRDELARLLQELPVEQRQVLVLREMEGLSYAEMAQILGVPMGTVTSRLIRARQRLRDLVKESGSDCLDPG